ncbi:MAG: DUF2087 domain-containing protein [Pseudomonadota bacterium]
MIRTPIPLLIEDVGPFTRALRRETGLEMPHQSAMNAVARAAGYRNFQHLSAVRGAKAAEVPPDLARVRKAAARFDDRGRFTGWPVKRSLRLLCLWPIWARLPAGQEMDERAISAVIHDLCTFRDAAGIRREMVGEGMLWRTRDGSVYRRVERAPDATQLALIRTVAT